MQQNGEKKESKRKLFIKYMKYFVLFRIAFARNMVQIAGAGLLLMWRFNAVLSFHYMKFHCCYWPFFSFSRAYIVLNAFEIAVVFFMLRFHAFTVASSKLRRITCDYYKSYYIVLFLLYKIRSSCRHFICSFHSYVVLCRLYRSTVSHKYMQSCIHSHSYSSHIFCVVGHSLMLSYVAVVHVLLWNAYTQRMFIQTISKTKNNTHIHPIRRSHREATKKTANIENNRKISKNIYQTNE